MDRVKILVEWITKRLFPISIIIFVLIYIWWLRLTPWNPQEYCCSNGHYELGLTLLVFYVGSGIVWWLTKNRNCLGMLLRIITIFFFAINSLYIAEFMPRVVDFAKYNGAQYYLVSYSNWPEHNPWDYYRLTKWRGFFRYDSHDVGIDGGFVIRYDEKMQLVNVVKVLSTNYERLVYSDSVPPRRYSYGIDVEFDGKRYYVSHQCNKNTKYPYLCDTYTYVLVHCELDNTSCVPFPFQYTGDYVFEIYIEHGNSVNDLNAYFDIGDYPGKKTLIYTYGDHPGCYIEGCEVLKDAQ